MLGEGVDPRDDGQDRGGEQTSVQLHVL